ncbi:MAG: hypothetical protein J0I12_25710 [Candidatus Eremiobacteraeota bacterium]|nr:hypothetical protein [Candidatus Eremiobacteraeota bacterium]
MTLELQKALYQELSRKQAPPASRFKARALVLLRRASLVTGGVFTVAGLRLSLELTSVLTAMLNHQDVLIF